jgi:hypothetical protein
MAERTTSTVRRGLESERRAENLRRSESAGALAAVSAWREEASGGREVAMEFVGGEGGCWAAALRRAACRRRCGRRVVSAGMSVVFVGVTGASVAGGAVVEPLERARRELERK